LADTLVDRLPAPEHAVYAQVVIAVDAVQARPRGRLGGVPAARAVVGLYEHRGAVVACDDTPLDAVVDAVDANADAADPAGDDVGAVTARLSHRCSSLWTTGAVRRAGRSGVLGPVRSAARAARYSEAGGVARRGRRQSGRSVTAAQVWRRIVSLSPAAANDTLALRRGDQSQVMGPQVGHSRGRGGSGISGMAGYEAMRW